MYHYRKSRKIYDSYAPSPDCDFCNPQERSSNITREVTHAYVIPNRTFYDQWELRRVVDHQMIIPKKHVLHMNALDQEERLDIINLIAEYESNGYEIYARSPKSVSRSIPHQHTHLIKTEGKPSRGQFFLRWPYILLRLR